MTKFVCFVLGLPTLWFKGYVLAALWRWFAVPLGLPSIGIASMLGFSLLAGLAVYNTSRAAKDAEQAPGMTDKQAIDTMLTAWLIPLVFLGLGRLILFLGTFA